jgi:hypothetical protein
LAVGFAAVEESDQFEEFVRTGLGRYGLGVDEIEMAVIRAAEALYGPQRDALLAADLSGIPYEFALDPSRSPADTGRAGG